VELGLADAVGVSNFSAARVRGAARALEARGTCLASNQVWNFCVLGRPVEAENILETNQPTNQPATQLITDHHPK
jgi:hypothetical protein